MKIRGITVTGNSRQAAEDAYRAVATGKSVTAYADANSEFVILCSADSEITPFNPLTGDADMVEAGSSITEKLEFQSESSNAVQQTNYVVCSTGCGSHVISDDIETRFCPSCADALPDDECPDCDEQSQNQVVASSQIIAGHKTLEGAVSAFRALASTGCTHSHVCGDIAVATNIEGFRFSPFLGDENIQIQAVAMAATASSVEESVPANHFQCMDGECGMHVIASTDDPVFCPSCSSGLIEPEEDESESEEFNEDDSDEESEEDLDSGEDDEESEEDESEESDDEEEMEEESNSSDSSDDSEDDLDTGEDEEDEEFSDDESDEESLSTATVTTIVPTVLVERPMLLCVAGAEPQASKLHVAYAGVINGVKTAVAFYDGVPVATANQVTAAAYSDLLDNSKLSQALISAAADMGVAPALAQMGFVDIKPQIVVEEIVQQQVAEQVSAQVGAIQATATAESKDLAGRMTAALATAAQGINSGFFKDVANPLIAALSSALSAIGMQNSEALVRKVFTEHNDGYVRNMVAKANQILDYDLQVQNELAEAVAGTTQVKEILPMGKPVNVPATVVQSVVQQESISSSTGFETTMNTALFSLGQGRR